MIKSNNYLVIKGGYYKLIEKLYSHVKNHVKLNVTVNEIIFEENIWCINKKYYAKNL